MPCRCYIDWDRSTATLGLWLGKPFWAGLLRGAGDRARCTGFAPLDLDLLAVPHLPENDKGARAIEKYMTRFGGPREGRLRNRLAFDDGPVDTVRYSVSQEEWATAVGIKSEVEFEDSMDSLGI